MENFANLLKSPRFSEKSSVKIKFINATKVVMHNLLALPLSKSN